MTVSRVEYVEALPAVEISPVPTTELIKKKYGTVATTSMALPWIQTVPVADPAIV